ncbi:hypothetical protein quinque_013417 [Culex quinquefasciatus]
MIEIEVVKDRFIRFPLSIFKGLCRLPKLRAVSICSYVPFSTPDEEYSVPDSFVRNLTVEVFAILSSILKFQDLFPRLTQLNVRQVVIDPDELQRIVSAWPTLEVLVLGPNTSLLDSNALEVLHQLSKLRKLELKTQVCYTDKHMEIEHLQVDFSKLSTLFRIPTLTELRLVHGRRDTIWWSGQIPIIAPSCRLFINNVYMPRTSPASLASFVNKLPRYPWKLPV